MRYLTFFDINICCGITFFDINISRGMG